MEKSKKVVYFSAPAKQNWWARQVLLLFPTEAAAEEKGTKYDHFGPIARHYIKPNRVSMALIRQIFNPEDIEELRSCTLYEENGKPHFVAIESGLAIIPGDEPRDLTIEELGDSITAAYNEDRDQKLVDNMLRSSRL